MAISIGTWASIMILVNFFWGMLVFQEPVADMVGTTGAFALLILGLAGMSRYSAPPEKDEGEEHATVLSDESREFSTAANEPAQSETSNETSAIGSVLDDYINMQDTENALDIDGLSCSNDVRRSEAVDGDFVILCGTRLTRRQAGILGAVFNGLMTGSSLVPLHYAKAQGFGGANYMISFACGATLANVLIWVLFYFRLCMDRSTRNLSFGSRLRTAYSRMPDAHFRKLWLPGFAAGEYGMVCFQSRRLQQRTDRTAVFTFFIRSASYDSHVRSNSGDDIPGTGNWQQPRSVQDFD